jgi:GNAT superfamily N-acetyltransferase
LREVRLTALVVNPMAFGSSHVSEVDRTDEMWEVWAASAAMGRDQAVFVTEADGRFVGLAGAFRMDGTPSTYHLFAMWTDPQHRRAGQGAALTEAVIAWVEQSGGTRISLWVVEGNDTARRLYERLGFEFTGATRPLSHQPDVTELEMARVSSPATDRNTGRVPAGYIEFFPMNAIEFERYVPDLIQGCADDLMRTDDLSAGPALERATSGIFDLLPQGVATPSHHLCTLRAGLEDTPVGSIWFGTVTLRDRTVTFIYDLTVDRTHRGRGLGTAALSELEDWSRVQGHDAIVLDLFEHNVGARRLCRRNEYEFVESDPGRLRMEKSLA